MKVVTVEQMKRIDRLTQQEYGVPGAILMERAALAVREALRADYGPLAAKRIVICCGKGNNGGDGLALARLLLEDGAEVIVMLAATPEQFIGSALENLERCWKFGLNPLLWGEDSCSEIAGADLIIDALLGTGAAGAPGGAVAAMIQAINDLHKPVVAVDAPTGVAMDTGQVPGLAVRADLTVTFGLPKPGLLCYPGAELAGRLVVDGIGFPAELLNAPEINIAFITTDEAKARLPRRTPTAHKGTAGHVLVVGGSPGMTGAVGLASLGALRSGCGLVTAALRPGLDFPEKPLEVMAFAWTELLEKLAQFKCIVVGPGLSTAPDGWDLLVQLLHNATVPLVIDADGLNLLAREIALFNELNATAPPLVLTPHPGEMARLTGLPTAAVQADRMGVAARFAKERGVVLVLKGPRTVIAGPDGRTFINSTGNAGMATAGMGDVLAGMIGGLIAQGQSPEEAAVAGTYLHGLAGDQAAARRGMAGMIASDLLGEIPEAIKKVLFIESIQ